MSEEAPEREPEYEPEQKIQTKCWKCTHMVKSSLANTCTFIYTKQPWNSHTQLQCQGRDCGAVTVLFHDQINEPSVETAKLYPMSIFEYCDQPDILQVRRDCTGAHDVETHELSARANTNIERWGEFLQKMVIDVSDFGGSDA